MKIIFDLRKVGLGNNGGSSTLVKSGNTLVDMGHEVYFIDSMRNQHKWTPLKAQHIIAKNINKVPDADVIIATGYKSVGPTVSAPIRCGLKAHWIRAWEHWQMGDDAIVKRILKASTIKIVNSICLHDKLKEYNTESFIIRPGYDFGELFPKNIREGRKIIVIGGLYREGVHGGRKRTEWLTQVARALKARHRNLKFWLFGSEKEPQGFLHDRYIRSPSMAEKNEFYNNIDVWMAPTMSEGLHLPPAEAMITECPVVSTNAPLSGTQDYVINGVTGLVSKNNLNDFTLCIDTLIKDAETRKRMGKEARKKVLDIGDRQKNMQELVSLVANLKEGK